MSLLESRLHYKPFEYGWAFEAYDMQQKMHWLPSEVPLHEDVRDWNERLSAEEKRSNIDNISSSNVSLCN